MRAARIGGRRELRFLESWIDDWLLREATDDDSERRVLLDGPARPDAQVSLR